MKRTILGLALALGLVASSTAQTVSNGPYYATPSWDQTLPAAQRFIVLANMGQQAVLDRETGLVWERDPKTAHPVFETAEFGIAVQICPRITTGGCTGWRLPSFHELASLADPTVTGLALPAGHPFLNITPTDYWSATASSGGADSAYAVTFSSGTAGTLLKTISHGVWCVRGGGPLSIY